jgi:hypothetical protein
MDNKFRFTLPISAGAASVIDASEFVGFSEEGRFNPNVTVTPHGDSAVATFDFGSLPPEDHPIAYGELRIRGSAQPSGFPDALYIAPPVKLLRWRMLVARVAACSHIRQKGSSACRARRS